MTTEQLNEQLTPEQLLEKEKEMSVIGHMEELRYRLIVCAASFLVFSIAAFTNVDSIRELFARPVGNLVYLGVTEAFTTNIKLSFIFGFLVASPIIFYQVWSFVLPGLHKGERAMTLFISIFSVCFFFLGVTFAFLIVLPFTIKFFLGFETEVLTPMFSFSSYISYSLGLIVGFGAVFEMPVVVMILAKLGMVTPSFLAGQRKAAVVIIFVLSAVFTPPDVISQVLMAVPLVLLFELSILLARIVQKRESMVIE